MKLYFGVVLLAAALCATAQTNSNQAQSGSDAGVQTSTEAMPKVTPKVVKQAQRKLNKAGYDAGPVDGKLGPKTRAAITKYQKDNGLSESGELDTSTLSKMNIGAGQTLATAPKDIGRGAKAAGHDIAKGHPVEAGKEMGKGFGRAGKAVGEGAKAGAVGTVEKVPGNDNSSQPSQNQPPQ